MYIREDADKLCYRRRAASAAALLLIIMVLGLVYVDAVCRPQADIPDQPIQQAAGPDHIASTDNMIAMGLTSADYDLICRVVAAEARGEGYEGQLAVAQVIRDRTQLWGMTPREVVTASGQFARPYQGEIGADVQAAVNDCLVLGESAFDGPVTHFCEVGVTPYWVKSKTFVGQIGHHKFYR